MTHFSQQAHFPCLNMLESWKQITWIKLSCLGNNVSSFSTPSIYPSPYFQAVGNGPHGEVGRPGHRLGSQRTTGGAFRHFPRWEGSMNCWLLDQHTKHSRYRVSEINAPTKTTTNLGIQHVLINIRFLEKVTCHPLQDTCQVANSKSLSVRVEAHVSTLSIPGKNWVPQTESGSPCHWYWT